MYETDRGVRKFGGAIVRQTCEKIYGGPISGHAWKNWRSWAKVGGSRSYTFEQYCWMAAIATLRAKNQYAELDAADVKAIAYSDDTINMLGALIRHIDDEGWAIGWDIRSALAVRGIEVSGAELKQQVSHLNPNRWYRVDDVANQLAVKRFN